MRLSKRSSTRRPASVIANPVGVHTEMVVPGLSGLIAATDDEWVEAVRVLAKTPDLARQMGLRRAGCGRVRATSVAAWAETFVDSIAHLHALPGSRSVRAEEKRTWSEPEPPRFSRTVPVNPRFQENRAAMDEARGQRQRHDGPRQGDWMSWLFRKIPKTPPRSDCSSRRIGTGPRRTTSAGGFAPDWKQALLGPRDTRLEEWRRGNGQLTVVKTGPHQVVYRADLPEGPSTSNTSSSPACGRNSASGFAAAKGGMRAGAPAMLAAIGVTTITPIALGEQRKRFVLFENYLITHAIPDTLPLDEFVENRLPQVPKHRQARIRQNLAAAAEDLDRAIA